MSNKEELRDKQEEYYLSSDLLNVKNINDLIKNGIKKSVWPVCKALVGDASELEKPDFVSCNFKNAEGKYPEPSQVVQVVDLLFEYMGYDKTDLKKKVLFWKTYKSMVKRELSDFRTTTVGLIRKSFLKRESIYFPIYSFFIFSNIILKITRNGRLQTKLVTLKKWMKKMRCRYILTALENRIWVNFLLAAESLLQRG